MSLGGISFFNAGKYVASFQISGMQAYGWGVTALVVTEISLRWRATEGSLLKWSEHQEHQSGRYLELAQGLSLLCLTGYSMSCRSGMGLSGITLIALRRLYGDIRVIPWVNELLQKNEWFLPQRKPFLDLSFHFIEIAACVPLGIHAGQFSLRNPLGGLLIALVSTMAVTQETKIFQSMVKAGYLDQMLHSTVAWKIERVMSFFVSLYAISVALAGGAMVSHISWSFAEGGSLLSKRINLFCLLTHCCCFFGIFALFILRNVDFLLYYCYNLRGSLGCHDLSLFMPFDLPRRSFFAQSSFRRQLLGLIYAASIGRLSPAIEEAIPAAVARSSRELKIQGLFAVALPFLSLQEIEQAIKEYPRILSPYFLVKQKRLWDIFNKKQISEYLLTPELNDLLNCPNKAILANLQSLGEKIVELEKPYLSEGKVRSLQEVEWKQLYPQLRPLYVQLGSMSFSKMLELLVYMPNRRDIQDITDQWNVLKPLLQEKEKEVLDLESRLEHLAGDLLKYAYEGLALTEGAIRQMLADWDIKITDSPTIQIQRMLEAQGVQFKGDLLEKGILAPSDNSISALQARLYKFFFPEKEGVQVSEP